MAGSVFIADGDYIVGMINEPYSGVKMVNPPKRENGCAPQCLSNVGIALLGVFPMFIQKHSSLIFTLELKKLADKVADAGFFTDEEITRLKHIAGNNDLTIITRKAIIGTNSEHGSFIRLKNDRIISLHKNITGKYLAYKRVYGDKRKAGQAAFKDSISEGMFYEVDISIGKHLYV